MSRVYVLAEDRPDFEVGLRLALASLFHNAPGAGLLRTGLAPPRHSAIGPSVFRA